MTDDLDRKGRSRTDGLSRNYVSNCELKRTNYCDYNAAKNFRMRSSPRSNSAFEVA
jgi:hypothetical protein